MTSLIPLKIWLGISVIAAFEAPPSPQAAADLSYFRRPQAHRDSGRDR